MKRTIAVMAFAAMLAAAQDKRLVFSTYHGGDRNDDAVSAAVDAAGYIYVTGETESRDLKADPVGGKPLTAAVFKAYLTKYAPSGKDVVWRKLIGGASNTVTHAVALDRDGGVFVAGTTGARDLPLMNPVQDKQTGLNIAFLMKFSAAGELVFSTYFGGERNEEGLALAVDSQGSVYLAGRASSSNLPVKNALQPQMAGGGQDGFIAKYSPDGGKYALAYATYFGGTMGTDNIYAIAVGPDDSLYLTGDTMSPGLATAEAYIGKPVSYSSFLAKLTPAGDKVAYFTYVGWAGGYTSARALAVDGDGRAYVGGDTTSKQLAVTPGAIQPGFAGGLRDAFLLRVNAAGTAAEYLTYLGGSTRGAADPDETVASLQLDSHGHVYVTGETSSPDFPGRRVVQATHGGAQDAYVMRLDLDNPQIIYSTFWGGQKKEGGLALALGPGENATLVGVSYSEDLPVANAVQAKIASGNDAFVAQICDPWLRASGTASFGYVVGGDVPVAQTVEVGSGCVQPFAVTEIAVSEAWVKVTADGGNVPLKLKVEANVEGMAVGEYTAVVRVSIAEAFYRTLEIPVVVRVTE
ncbi:MAG: SBBP repeat-containing protein [Acidobacteria bacterium]|nr:SBBP repeat-containing protein [Acidobacteriota bacterium]